MRWILLLSCSLGVFLTADAGAQPGYCDCFGGIHDDGSYWQLLDHQGNPLEDGDWAYAAWTGPDGIIDPPDAQGYPTGDDVLLPIAKGVVEFGTFSITVASWQPGDVDRSGDQHRPMDGDFIYCRIFDNPEGSLGLGSYYADSQLHQIVWKFGDMFFCRFPGDPGHGQANIPLPEEPAEADSTDSHSSDSKSVEE